MAICFELVVNFGDNLEAAQSTLLALASAYPTTLQAGSRRIPLHRPILSGRARSELAVIPVSVGFLVGLDGTLPTTKLTLAELTELGHGLYRLLAKFSGYVAAKVGWDPEGLTYPSELRNDWADELADGSIDGLVLCEALYAELGLGSNYVEFRPGYRWIPYRGEKTSPHIAD